CGVIMMSGYAERTDLVRAMASNVSGFIDKPFNPIEFIEMVRAVARKQTGQVAVRKFLTQLSELSSEKSALNAAYFRRLAELEETLFQTAPEVFEDRAFKESYVKFMKSTGAMNRKISSSEEQVAVFLEVIPEGRHSLQKNGAEEVADQLGAEDF
ncbi:MAG: response regulator, partial [Bdellovibrionales bacterium]|nr:response regulator [Bdellovibrionales bacterium]